MALETGSYECTYRMPCQMALDNQLSTSELDLLFHNLEQELVKKILELNITMA